MTQAQQAAQEVLKLFKQANAGVTHVSPLLFKGKSRAEVEAIKLAVGRVLARYRC
jgi:hypothetical protein